MIDAKVLMVGVGGLGSAVAAVLARSGIRHLTLLDDDIVDRSNLHRQLLFTAQDEGQPKVQVAAVRLRDMAPSNLEVVELQGRFTPDSAGKLVHAHTLVIEGADNMATKFLAADACHLADVPVVQAGVVRWDGWAHGWAPGRPSACLRCVFEDIPHDRAETCAEAGVVGPAVGVVAALQSALALELLLRPHTAAATPMWSYSALRGRVRSFTPRPRPSCPLCSGEISELKVERYLPPECAA